MPAFSILVMYTPSIRSNISGILFYFVTLGTNCKVPKQKRPGLIHYFAQETNSDHRAHAADNSFAGDI
jgi:hypothetical protein